jgi:hypothetical protein
VKHEIKDEMMLIILSVPLSCVENTFLAHTEVHSVQISRVKRRNHNCELLHFGLPLFSCLQTSYWGCALQFKEILLAMKGGKKLILEAFIGTRRGVIITATTKVLLTVS